jgi:hypothetical protein
MLVFAAFWQPGPYLPTSAVCLVVLLPLIPVVACSCSPYAWAIRWLPHKLRMLLANFWTKYLNRSWIEGVSWFAQVGLDTDLVISVVNWQWAIGFFVRDTAAWLLVVVLRVSRSLNGCAMCGDDAVVVLCLQNDPNAPHAGIMADPRGVLYARKCDPGVALAVLLSFSVPARVHSS